MRFGFLKRWAGSFLQRGGDSWYAPTVAVAVTLPWLACPTGIPSDHHIHHLAAQEWLSAWRNGVWWPAYFDDVNAGLGSPWPSYYPPLYHALVRLAWVSVWTTGRSRGL